MNYVWHSYHLVNFLPVIDFRLGEMKRSVRHQMLEIFFNLQASFGITNIGDVSFWAQIWSQLKLRLGWFHQVEFDQRFQDIFVKSFEKKPNIEFENSST